jgi:hypothetical protein
MAQGLTLVAFWNIEPEGGRIMRTVKAVGLALTLLMGIFIILSFYWMSLNGRYTAIFLGVSGGAFPIMIVDTRTVQVTIKTMVSAETPVGEPWNKLRTIVPWSD